MLQSCSPTRWRPTLECGDLQWLAYSDKQVMSMLLGHPELHMTALQEEKAAQHRNPTTIAALHVYRSLHTRLLANLFFSRPSRSEFKAYRVSTARTLVVPAMALKTFATLLLLSCLAGAAAGPMVCATCYTACIAGCWANGVAATAATLGVAAPAGLWGAAACSSMCAPTCACLCPTPTP